MNVKKLVYSFINGAVVWFLAFAVIAALVLLALYQIFVGFYVAFGPVG